MQRIEHDLDLAADQVGDTRRTTLVRYVLYVDPRYRPEHFGGEVAGRAYAGSTVIQFARLAFGKHNQVRKIIDRLRWINDDRDRPARDQGERREIASPHCKAACGRVRN